LNLSEILGEIYRLKFGAEPRRKAQELEELFLFLLVADYMGVSTFLKFYLLEAYPQILEEFHKWHKRLGIERSPLDWLRCC